LFPVIFVTFPDRFWKLESDAYNTECNRINKHRNSIEYKTHQHYYLHSVSHFRNSFVKGKCIQCCLIFSCEYSSAAENCVYIVLTGTRAEGAELPMP
jgi:hypothetical protein